MGPKAATPTGRKYTITPEMMAKKAELPAVPAAKPPTDLKLNLATKVKPPPDLPADILGPLDLEALLRMLTDTYSKFDTFMLWNAFTVRYLHVVIEAYRNDNRPWTPAARLLGQMLHSPYFHRWLATLTTPSGLALRQIERCSSWEAEKAEPATIIRMLTLVADLAALEKLNATDHLTQTVKNDFRRRIMAWMKRYAENSPLVDLVEENLTIFTVGSTGREASDEHRTEITIYQRKCSLPDCNIHGSAEEKNSLFQCSRCHIFRYCTGNHQRLDWVRHKRDCYVVAWV